MKIRALLLENGKKIELFVPCPECLGNSTWMAMSCNRCGNTGEVPRYWTVERLDVEQCHDTPVWIIFTHSRDWTLWHYGANIDKNGAVLVMAFPTQPKPPTDWTDKAQQEYLDEWGIE